MAKLMSNWWVCIYQNHWRALMSRWFDIICWINQVVMNPTPVSHFKRHSLKWYSTAFLLQRSRVYAYIFMIYLCVATIYFGKVEQKTSNLREVKLEITLGHFYYGWGSSHPLSGPSKETPWHCGADRDPSVRLAAFVFPLVWVKETVVQRAMIRASWLQNCLCHFDESCNFL